jgi:DNA-directed RNA polymerase subunit omega
MDTIGYDKLLNLTDSRYRLSTIVAKRAVQLKKGFPSTLAQEDYPKDLDRVSHNVVAVALREVLLNKHIVWGKTLPSDAELIEAFEHKRHTEISNSHTIFKQEETDLDDEPNYVTHSKKNSPYRSSSVL